MKLNWKAATVWSLVSGILTNCGSSAGLDAPLSVASVSPANQAMGVSLGVPIVIVFSKALQAGSANDSTVSLVTRAIPVPGSILVAPDGRTVTFSPRGGLGNNLSYRLAVQGVKDQSGQALAAPFASAFTTAQATVTLQDQAGDTYGVASPGLVQPDITSLTATQDSAGVVIVMQFVQAVQPSTSGGANVVGGYIDLDTDQDSTTGIVPSITDIFRPPTSGSTGLGDEFVVSLFLNPDGTAAVIDALNAGVVGTVTPVFNGNVLTIRIPLALLKNDDGNVNVATVVGTVNEPTDIAPNMGHLTLGTSAGISASSASAIRSVRDAPRVLPFAGVWSRR